MSLFLNYYFTVYLVKKKKTKKKTGIQKKSETVLNLIILENLHDISVRSFV